MPQKAKISCIYSFSKNRNSSYLFVYCHNVNCALQSFNYSVELRRIYTLSLQQAANVQQERRKGL